MVSLGLISSPADFASRARVGLRYRYGIIGSVVLRPAAWGGYISVLHFYGCVPDLGISVAVCPLVGYPDFFFVMEIHYSP